MIEGCGEIKVSTDGQLTSFLNKKAAHSQATVTETDLSNMVTRSTCMGMCVKPAHRRSKLFFMDCKSLLRQLRVFSVTTNNEKRAVRQVVLVIKPAQLKNRSEQDFSFVKKGLASEFMSFTKHALDLSTAFEKLDSENPSSLLFELGCAAASPDPSRKKRIQTTAQNCVEYRSRHHHRVHENLAQKKNAGIGQSWLGKYR